MATQSFEGRGNLRAWPVRNRRKAERPVDREGSIRKLRRSLRQLLWRRRQSRDQEKKPDERP
ncbi:MAG TPA: hypothetical protein ENK08_11125 [Chloroflexi bacterium]|nr:hypothetical protein [Chloroflexota bacterium]